VFRVWLAEAGVDAAFGVCTTDVPENRRDWPKLADYDERLHALLLRDFEASDRRVPWNPIFMPNRKTDTNNFASSTDYIGGNHAYPEADRETRDRIVAEHRRYQQGLMWMLANHSRVPEQVRATRGGSGWRSTSSSTPTPDPISFTSARRGG